MLNFLRSLGLDTLARAQALKILRWLATVAGVALTTWLISKGISAADATAIATAVGGLIIGVGSALVSLGFALLDGRRVDTKMKTTQAVTAATVASAIQTGATTPAAIAATAQQALAQGDGASKQLSSTLAALRAGAA
ncbi:MAG TPA: hypothetical protein VNX86_04835 [Rhizomicrobium sp.]|jgi:hypothetical protein|nr:hypothetical protein [Rhizomicrobium sp.]